MGHCLGESSEREQAAGMAQLGSQAGKGRKSPI